MNFLESIDSSTFQNINFLGSIDSSIFRNMNLLEFIYILYIDKEELDF